MAVRIAHLPLIKIMCGPPYLHFDLSTVQKRQRGQLFQASKDIYFFLFSSFCLPTRRKMFYSVMSYIHTTMFLFLFDCDYYFRQLSYNEKNGAPGKSIHPEARDLEISKPQIFSPVIVSITIRETKNNMGACQYCNLRDYQSCRQ